MLGAPCLEWPGRSLPLNVKDAMLLARLALDGPTPREQLAAWLWPGDAAAARNALRQRVFRLRHASGIELIGAAEPAALYGTLEVDLHDWPALESDPAHALEGELLGAQSFAERPELAQWLDDARERWRQQRREALASLAARWEAADRIADALKCASRLAQGEPLAEHSQRRLMRLHARRGDRGAAMLVYEQLRRALDEQLGETPAAETESLARQIEAGVDVPLARAPVHLPDPPRMVGRGGELARCMAAHAAGRIVCLVGEPGIGKSRMLAEMALWLRPGASPAGAFLHVGARPGDARLSLALLARLVEAVVDALHARSALGQLGEHGRAEMARLAPRLGAAAPGRIQPARLWRGLESALSVLRAVAPPGLLVLDDLHCADEASLEALPVLAPHLAALAWRAHQAPAQLHEWARAQDARIEIVELGPLDPSGVAELIDSLALDEVRAADWAERVHHASGGNPLFVLETLRALVVAPQPSLLGAAPRAPTVQRLIGERLSQLSTSALKLARLAAVAQADFTVELAAAVLGIHPLDQHDAWVELEAAQVLSGTRFSHDLVAEVAHDAIPIALRRWLHAQVARHADGVMPSGRRAAHWREAGQPGLAAGAYLEAAQAALAGGRLAEQCRWLEAAAAAHDDAGDGVQAFEARRQLVIAAREARAPSETQALASALLAQAVTSGQRGQAQLQLGSCWLNAARFDLARPALQAAIGDAAAAGDHGTAQHARYLLALALAQSEGAAQALAQIEPLAPWAESQADESLRLSFAADHAILCEQADQRRRALPMFERALQGFDRRNERGNAAPTRMMMARCQLALGQVEAARALLETAVRQRYELSEGEGGDGIEVLNLGRVYIELGRYADALELLEPSVQRLAGRGSPVVRCATALALARVWAHLGQSARALALLATVDAEAAFHQRAGADLVRATLLPDRPVERERLLAQALATLESGPDMPQLRLQTAFELLACRCGKPALQALRAGVAECEQRELPGVQMLGRLRLAQVLAADGDASTALVVLRDLVHELGALHPVGVYLPELRAACIDVGDAAGDAVFARRALERAVQWIASVSQEQVPKPFRDSFAQRNPVNRRLLAAALR